MKILRTLDAFPATERPIILALGNFDGMHIGHTAVIRTAIDAAQERGGQAWVFTFDPHPACLLNPGSKPVMIATRAQQSRYLAALGVEGCILQSFTPEFMQQKPVAFFQQLCDGIPGLAGISVGANWSFGHDRSGSAKLLAGLCAGLSLFFSAHPDVIWQNKRVSSSRVRAAIATGDLEGAHAMLGRPAAVYGKVVHGEKIGRSLGCPTANVEPENECLPPAGIYAARMLADGQSFDAAAYIGKRKTFHADKPTVLEVHLLHETGIDLYDQFVEVEFCVCVRKDLAFPDSTALKAQIENDLSAICSMLG